MSKFVSTLVLALFMVSLVACSGAVTPTATPEPQTASIQLSWVHSLEFAGLYAANTQGFFGQENLTLNFHEGGFSSEGAYIDPISEVVSGKATFGIAGADVVLRARSAGAPVVAVMSIFQRSPATLIALPESDIQTPKDIAGKRVGIAPPNTTMYISYQALMQSQGVDMSTVTEIPMDATTSVEALMNGDIDVLHAFATHEATLAKMVRDDLEVLVMSDYGIDIYNNVVFTTEDTIKNHPELVQALVNGTTKGLDWAVDHPQDAANMIIATYGQTWPSELQELQKKGMLASVPLIRPSGMQPGMMNADTWDTTLQVLETQALLEGPVEVKAAYNLDFLKQAYATTTQ